MAVPLALLLEGASWLKRRWSFTQSDLDRLWNLCVALFLGGTIYAFFSTENLNAVGELVKDGSASGRLATLNQSKRSLFQLLQWLPLMFLPIALAQAYAAQRRFDLSTFSWWLRRKRGEPGYAQRYPTGLNVSYPFFACCVFSASTSNQRTLWFSAALVAIVAWPLCWHRPRNVGPFAWTSSFILALGLGVAAQFGMLELQRMLQRLDEALLSRWTGSRSLDAKENQTRLGAIGHMKLSGRILFRVTPGQERSPELLREGSYNIYHAPFWSVTKRDFERLTPEASQASWTLRPATARTETATVAGFLPGGTGLLPVPQGVTHIDQLPALGMSTNLFGSVRAEDGPGFVEFEAAYQASGSIDAPPTEADREIPLAERAAVLQMAEQLNLASLPPGAAVSSVERLFNQRFKYSTWQGWDHRPNQRRTALARFLLEHRSGHCEYFATATVLLLRAAHVPTRYAIGYSVQEKSGHSYIVRERHAHAWCLAWIDGQWRDVDTTPPDWGETEATRASIWEPVRDLFSRFWFEFSRWRWGHAEWKRYLLWLVVPVLVLALARVLVQRQWGRAMDSAGEGLPRSRPGLDSEFYAIAKWLTAAGLPRLPGETGTAWLERLQKAGAVPIDGLREVLTAHYRLRFHPEGLAARQRAQLRHDAEWWLRSSRPVSGRFVKESAALAERA